MNSFSYQVIKQIFIKISQFLILIIEFYRLKNVKLKKKEK